MPSPTTPYEISETYPLKVTVLADEETLINLSLSKATPTVKNIVSFPATAALKTIQFSAAGVPAEPIIPIRYVAETDAVLQIAIVEITAVVEAPVL
jgi:hypothetical protein